MKISHEKPPNWETISKLKGVRWEDGIIVTYGDTCYCQNDLSDDVQAHEKVHVRQQILAGGPDAWWQQWLGDENFRLHEEVEAYRAQYNYLRESLAGSNRKERAFTLRRMAEQMAMALSAEMYGGIITYARALELIKQ